MGTVELPKQQRNIFILNVFINKFCLKVVDIFICLDDDTNIHVDISCVLWINISRSTLITIIVSLHKCFHKNLSGFEGLLSSNFDIQAINTLEIQFNNTDCSDSKVDNFIFTCF